ncbi:hypothetical protein IFM89_025532, partial [Coptis chinensis]
MTSKAIIQQIIFIVSGFHNYFDCNQQGPTKQTVMAWEECIKLRRNRTLRGKARGPTLEAPVTTSQSLTTTNKDLHTLNMENFMYVIVVQVQQGVINPYLGQQYLQIYGVPSSLNAAIYPYGQSHQPLPSNQGYTAIHGYTMPGHHIVQFSGANVNALTAAHIPTNQAPYPAERTKQANDNVEFAGEVQFQIKSLNRSGDTNSIRYVGNIESLSEKIDMTDVFATDT